MFLRDVCTVEYVCDGGVSIKCVSFAVCGEWCVCVKSVYIVKCVVSKLCSPQCVWCVAWLCEVCA